MPKITVNNIEIYYEQHGTGEPDPRCLYVLQQRALLWKNGNQIHPIMLMAWGYSKQFFNDKNKVADTLAFFGTMPTTITLAGYKHQLAAFSQHDTHSLLSQFKAPTLVLSLAEDILTPPSDGHHLAGKISNAKYHEVDAQTHVFHFEAPRAFTKLVKTFLLARN